MGLFETPSDRCRWRACASTIGSSCLLAAALAHSTDAGAAAPEYHFRAATHAAPLALGAQVLNGEERAFLAGLAELRVAVPLPPSRPYEVIDGQGEISGVHPEILMELAQTFGLRLRPVVYPDWTSVLQAARKRDVDIVMTVGVTTERLQYLEFTLGVTPLPGALFAAARTAAPLAGARFALERDYMTNDFVRRQFPDATIVTTATTHDALATLAKGGADYYLGSLLEVTDLLAREPVPGIEVKQLLNYGTGYYHFGVRKDLAPLAAILNKGISTMRDSPPPELVAAQAALPPALHLPASIKLNQDEIAQLLARPTWRIGAVRGLPMLNDIDNHQMHSGIAAEYVEQVARRLGVGVSVIGFDNVAAMLAALRAGAIDVVPFLTRTPERAAEFAFSKPYVEMPYMIVARSDAPLYWDLDSLRGRRLALALEHPLRALLARRHPDIEIVDVANGNEAMDAVVAGRADAAVEVKLFANLRINGDNDGVLRAVTEVDELPAQFHFAAARNAAALIPLIDRALDDIGDAERQRMLRRWVALDLRPAFPWRKYAPLIAVVVAALALLAGVTVWWMRRLAREVKRRRLAQAELRDIGLVLPGVTFRYVMDRDLRLVRSFYSEGAVRFLGIQPDPSAFLLDRLAPQLTLADLERARQAQRASVRGGETFKITTAYAHPDGRTLWLHSEVVPSETDDGLTAWTGYIVDVTPERDLQAQLKQAIDAKNMFIATTTHELRAPAHTLSLTLQKLAESGLDEQQRSTLRLAEGATRDLAELVNDVLDFARIEAGQLQLRVAITDLPSLAAHLTGSYRPAADRKGLRLTLKMGADVPRTAMLDPMRVRQVINNLLSNAMKYTERGEVGLRLERIAAATSAGSGSAEQLRFIVSDTGIGIPSEQQARLFKPFATVERAIARDVPEGSTGLGLAISRRLAELMGGQIELASVLGRGTEVQFTLPLRAEEETAGETVDAATIEDVTAREAAAKAAAVKRAADVDAPDRKTTPASGKSTRDVILICDDHAASRMLLVQLLAGRGYTTAEAGDGAAALARWRSGDVGAVITDLRMPAMDGAELVRAIRSAETGATARTPIVVCSGDTEVGFDRIRDQIDAFVVKPVRLDELLRTLEALGVVPPEPLTGC